MKTDDCLTRVGHKWKLLTALKKTGRDYYSRSVYAKGNLIEDITLPAKQTRVLPTYVEYYTKTIYENERDHIISVLKKCNGKIWGKGGAADVLNVPPTTPKSKMKRLDIEKGRY